MKMGIVNKTNHELLLVHVGFDVGDTIDLFQNVVDGVGAARTGHASIELQFLGLNRKKKKRKKGKKKGKNK
jgi:hypothetical protein